MPHPAPTILRPALAVIAVTLVSACASPSTPPASPPGQSRPSDVVVVTLTDQGCRPQPAAAPAGEVTFDVRNSGGAGLSQVAVQQADGLLIGVQDNLAPGRSGSIVVWLNAGSYRVACPGAGTSSYLFVVTGQGLQDWTTQPALTAAVAEYVAYNRQQAGMLATQLQSLDAAMHRGQLGAARTGYAAARVTYEHIEQAIPDLSLDLAMNGTLDRVASLAQLTGFHRLEWALWQEDSTEPGLAAADALVGDSTTLRQELAGIQPQPADITNEAVSSITNAVSSRLTGEEEGYSHLGLLMMQADLASAAEAYGCVRPWLLAAQQPLVSRIDAQFAAAQAALTSVEVGGTYPPDTSLSQAQTRTIAMRFDSLAAAMSTLAVLWSDDDGS
jgi:iron uptake system component EfeO